MHFSWTPLTHKVHFKAFFCQSYSELTVLLTILSLYFNDYQLVIHNSKGSSSESHSYSLCWKKAAHPRKAVYVIGKTCFMSQLLSLLNRYVGCSNYTWWYSALFLWPVQLHNKAVFHKDFPDESFFEGPPQYSFRVEKKIYSQQKARFLRARN